MGRTPLHSFDINQGGALPKVVLDRELELGSGYSKKKTVDNHYTLLKPSIHRYPKMVRGET